MKDSIKDAAEFVTEVVRRELWSAEYHQLALAKAYKHLAFAKELIERLDVDPDEHDRASVNPNDEDDVVFENVEQFALSILDEKESSVEYHEDQLLQAHRKIAFAKTMLARGNYTDIDTEKLLKDYYEALTAAELKKTSA